MNAKLYTLLGVCFLVFACKKTATPPEPTGPVTTTEINTWILDNLKRYNYYSNQLVLSIDKNQDPKTYFSALKSVNDRFSYLELPDGNTSQSISCRTKFGFDFVILREPTTNTLVGLVTLVMDSSFTSSILQRGDYFTSINNTTLTEQNSAQLAQSILSQNSFTLGMVKAQAGQLVSTGFKTLIPRNTPQQMVKYGTFSEAGKKIGYLFLSGMVNDEVNYYVNAITSLKDQGISELILDFRYNVGGDVSVAATIASMLSSGIKANDIFVEYRGNTNMGIRKDSFSKAISLGNGPSFENLQSANLNLSRVYILTSPASASAAELMIIGLKPYLSVVHIGETTRGKDEAAIRISDERKTKRIDYILHPIVYKVYNAQGLGNYATGLLPKYEFKELEHLPLGKFAFSDEPMISNCLLRITGMLPSSGAMKTNAMVNTPIVYNSARNLATTSNLVLN
jgi:carboxyl-terminal processing protease